MYGTCLCRPSMASSPFKAIPGICDFVWARKAKIEPNKPNDLRVTRFDWSIIACPWAIEGVPRDSNTARMLIVEM